MDVSAFQQQLQTMLSSGGNAMNGSMGGTMAEFEALTKALQTTTYQTDVSKLDGGAALGVQSLDTAMKTVIQENEHFVFFNRLAQTSATNVVDEYTRQNHIGGWLGGSTNTQMGVVRPATGEYEREVGFVKFLMTLRQVGYVLNIGKNIAEPVAVEERNGALQLLTDANYLLYHGNAAASPTQFDGIVTQLLDAYTNNKIADDQIVDMKGKALEGVDPFSRVQTAVSAYGSWGNSTDVFLPYSVQHDLNMGLDPAFRWNPEGQNTPIIGGHVEGIRLTRGILKTNMDTFIQDETNPAQKPFEVTNPVEVTRPELATLKPDSVNGSVVNATGVGTFPTGKRYHSEFTTSRAGDYVYAVASIHAGGAGYSPCAVSGTVTIPKDGGAKLVIKASTSGAESGYAIYRSKQKDTSGTVADMRLVAVIPKAGATTDFYDDNSSIPGTVTIPVLNMAPGADAIGWRQFQPMTKIPLPFGVGGMPVMSWFQFLFGYLRVTKPKHHGLIKNILPKNAIWRPHDGE